MKINTVGTNPAITANDISTVFVGNNEFDDRSVTLLSGANLLVGTVMGPFTANENLALFQSGNSDGTQRPKYVLAEPISSAGGETKDNVRVCTIGKIDSSQLFFDGTDAIDTIVSGVGVVKDLMKDAGLLVLVSRELSSLDNGASFA